MRVYMSVYLFLYSYKCLLTATINDEIKRFKSK